MKACFAFSIANLPMPTPFNRKEMQKVSELLKSLDGMIAVTPYYPHGTLLFFETLNQAKIARNQVRATGNVAGNHIMHATISDDMKSVEIGKPADMEGLTDA